MNNLRNQRMVLRKILCCFLEVTRKAYTQFEIYHCFKKKENRLFRNVIVSKKNLKKPFTLNKITM